MFHKVKNVTPLDDMQLMVEFVEGGRKKYDVKPLLIRFEVFRDLVEKNLFNFVHVDCGGYGIAWNEEIDLGCDELWHNGSAV